MAHSLDSEFNPVSVRGEVTGFVRAASGHCYFALKDETAQIRCAMFRRAALSMEFSPSDGELVEVLGQLGIYDARGDLQLVVENIKRAGVGALFEQFLNIKARLQAQGLFDIAKKRVLPTMPRGIGVVTSLGSAAMHDVMTTLSRRLPHVAVVLSPASVQGNQAPAEMIRALSNLYRLTQAGQSLEDDHASSMRSDNSRQNPIIDVILLVRGGGSLEDLWAFNDEQLVRVLAQSPVPTVCGVGHETDFTLVDLASDVRAPTPTAAAELVAQSRDVWQDTLQRLARSLHESLYRLLDRRAQRLDMTVSRLARPSALVGRLQMRIASSAQRLHHAGSTLVHRHQRDLQVLQPRVRQAMEQGLTYGNDRLGRAALRLGLLDPTLVLQRGYAWLTTSDGKAVTNAAQTRVGQRLHATLAHGGVDLTVSGKK